MRCLTPLLSFVLLSPVMRAQTKSDSILSRITFLKTDYDTNYIYSVPKRWEVHLYLQEKNNSFTSKDRTDNDKIFFEPLTNLTLGGGGSYRNFSLDYGFAIGNNRGDTAHAVGVDLITSLYVGQHIFDFGFRRFKGYYVSGYDSAINQAISIFRSDIVTANLFVNYLYNFNYRHFSLNASFIGSQIQRKSAGAPLAGIFFNYNDIHSNESIVPPQFQDPESGLLDISEANIWSTGVMAGYAYTFVLPLRFYLTLSIVPGFAINAGEYKTAVYHGIGKPLTASFKLQSKNAFGYASEKFYSYISISSDKNWVRLTNKDQFANNLSKWKLLVGYLID